jgi:hypothetical protein
MANGEDGVVGRIVIRLPEFGAIGELTSLEDKPAGMLYSTNGRVNLVIALKRVTKELIEQLNMHDWHSHVRLFQRMEGSNDDLPKMRDIIDSYRDFVYGDHT